MDHSYFIVCSFKENSIGPKRISTALKSDSMEIERKLGFMLSQILVLWDQFAYFIC